MELVSFTIEENVSKKTGKTYYVLCANTKNGDKFFVSFINKTK